MTLEWVDVRIPARIDSGELLGLLGDPLVQGAWDEPGTTHLYWSRQDWTGEHLGRLRAAIDHLDPTGVTSAAMQIGDLPHQDWNRQWAQSVKPLQIGRRIVIRPSWEPVTLAPAQFDIILDPKQAFGTGHHATTRMLLEWLEDLIVGGETVLDVGSGSGILAMAALKLGARSAIGVENDPVAVECARDYVRDNRFGPELELICGTLEQLNPRRHVDLALANLDRQTLLSVVEELAPYGLAGARLLFSGVLVDQEEEVLACYASRGLYRTARREQDGWVALELQAGEGCEGMGR